jgi:outer membrane receptor for ferrienterochelin and colicins
LTNATKIFPAQPPNFFVPQNRIAWTDRGVFGQLKYQPNSHNILYFGYRFDYNSSYGAAPTLRLGYVRKQGNFIFKAFYGEAFQEPPPRLLYGGWTGSGSDPSLKPERSQTAEMTLNYTNNAFSHDLSFYVFNAENSVIGVAGGAKNLGERQVIGLSYGLHGQVDWFKKTTFWLNYSWLIYEREQKFDRQANNIGEGIIGDLAHHKIQAGINSQLNKRLNANLIARFISDKNTVDTNPIQSVEAYLLVDANITYQILRSLTINLKVVNLLNQKYFHTGIRTANGGQSEGFWTNRAWNGSKGFFNSLVPQSPILFSVGLNLDI